MVGHWKIDRPFTHEGVSGYYTEKIKAFPIPSEPLRELPRNVPTDLPTLVKNLKKTATELGLPLPSCDPQHPYLWSEAIAQAPSSLLWRFREYVFALAMRFVGMNPVSVTRKKPTAFRIEDHSFTIVGSSELSSDIDITIQGPHSSYVIALLEDLFITLTQKGIPIRCWDVEFYGDFRLLRSVFIQSRKWSVSQRILLLKYALVSYYRSTHQHGSSAPILSPSATALVQRALYLTVSEGNPSAQWIQQVYQAVVQTSYDYWNQTAPHGVLNRELFYRELARIESDSATIRLVPSKNQPAQESNDVALGREPSAFAFGLFTAMAAANIHRAESYILPSTAVHVVEWEQKKGASSNPAPIPDAWFSSNARVGIDPFGFLLSALEQLGYLEHYHPPTTACSKKGVKYMGRYIRALIQANILPPASPFQPIYEQLNAYRSTKDPAIPCPYNIHEVLQQILPYLSPEGPPLPEGLKGPKGGRRVHRGPPLPEGPSGPKGGRRVHRGPPLPEGLKGPKGGRRTRRRTRRKDTVRPFGKS